MAEKRCPSCLQEYNGANCACGYPEKGQNTAHQLPVGTILRGRYIIGKALGQGGFGITYLAWDKLMQEKVAVKEFYPGGIVFRRSAASTAVECGTEEIIPHYEYSKERFLREAGALVKFKDIPEIVDILDFAEENNTAYIVMEYVRGMDLAKYINMKGGKLSLEETFRILRPVMEALAKVHKGGIVHRDISPDNIILDPMGGAKLLDFGAVRAVEDPDVDKGLNKSTEAILKQGFAPIEQYNTRGNLGPWTDEYAVCATVWYCLTGTVPAEASIRVSEGIDPDWVGIPGLPEHQQKALEKGMACRAKDRYRSLDELLEALFPKEETAAAAEIPTVVEPKSAEKPEKAEKPPREKKPKDKKMPLLFVAAVAIVLILVAAFVLIPGKQESTSPALLQDTPGTLPSEAPGETQPNTPETVPTTEATEPPSEEELAYQNAEALLAEGKLGEAAIAFGKLAGYSDARERSFEIWDKIAVREAVSAGTSFTAALKNDGTVVGTGWISSDTSADALNWTDIIAISSGSTHIAGLKADGTVVAEGDNGYGQCNVESWTDIVAISTRGNTTVGLRADGTVIATGENDHRQCDLWGWYDIVSISAASMCTFGLKTDGTVITAGGNSYGMCDVEDWTDIAAITSCFYHSLGIRSDGSIVAAGDNSYGQCYNPRTWTDIVALAAGGWHSVGLRSDGTVVAAGWYKKFNQCSVADWTDIVAISAGFAHTVALKSDGTVVAVGRNWNGECEVWDWADIRVPEPPLPFR